MKNKYKNILIIALFIFMLSSNILPKEVNNLDELWNYNFARNIANGLEPYKDFNIIITPLIPMLCGLILKIFGEQLIIMRIIGIFLNSAILFMVYKILKHLKINKYFSMLCTLIIYGIYYNYFCIDYNFAILFIILLTIYLELKNLDKTGNLLKLNIKKDILLGILVGASILIKHTTGMFFSLIFIFYKILIINKDCDKKDIFKSIISRLIGVFVPVLIFTIYLSINYLWNDFLDYTIYGIKTFDNNISYINLLKGKNLTIKALAIIIPTTILYMYIRTIVLKLIKDEDKKIFILFCYSVACFIVAFPISDSIHFLIGSMPAIISLIYIICTDLKKIKLKKEVLNLGKEFIKAFSILSITYLIILALILIGTYFSNYSNFSNLKHFKFVPSELDDRIIEVDNYILDQNSKGKKVYILDATACIYMIPLDKYNKDYDMFNKGNLGSRGEEGQIENLENEENAIVLILNDNYSRNWQNPERVRKYIIKNWNKTGEISIFDIYEK